MGKVNKGLMSSNSVEWETPDVFFQHTNKLYGPFTLDVCATAENAKCSKYYTKDADGLKQDWSNEICWMNPPYGADIKKWMKKAYEESLNGTRIVCLVPSRTDTAWWHEYAAKGKCVFIRGRLKFKGAESSAPFPSALVIYN
jgi:phage N-6-adenine-methyltransferase